MGPHASTKEHMSRLESQASRNGNASLASGLPVYDDPSGYFSQIDSVQQKKSADDLADPRNYSYDRV